MNKPSIHLAALAILSAAMLSAPKAARAQEYTDTCLKAATETVQKSDKYLHQSKLRRGMKGYGLTVMAGVEISRFDAEVVSVLHNFSPQRDVILVRLSGLNLENTGVIQGMSGSPVYIQDPGDGKYKMIGAVAYGWSFQKEPLAGVQPIAQMLAVNEAACHKAESQPTSLPVQTAGGGFPLNKEFLASALTPVKENFVKFGSRPQPSAKKHSTLAAELKPLETPLMMAGLSERTQARLEEMLAGTSLHLVAAGSAAIGAGQREECEGLSLQPGSSLCVPLVSGDADLSATGTVTEVLGDRVLGFGHPFFGNGSVCYPMATGYVHTVISNMSSSFKLASCVKPVGELMADESTGIGGVVGRGVCMIPVTVEVQWDGQSQSQVYHYSVLQDQTLTDLLASMVATDSIWGTRNLPPEHTLDYSVTVDYGRIGKYHVSNISANNDIFDAISDLSRPLAIMSRNPFGMAPVKSINMKVNIREGGRLCKLMGLSLDRNSYAPGDTVTVAAQLWQWHGERFAKNIEVTLPEDLPEGEYTLTVGDYLVAAEAARQQHPQKFDPRNLNQLLESLQMAAETRADRLYAVLHVNNQSLAVQRNVLPGVPGTIGGALRTACPLEVSPVEKTIITELPLDSLAMGQEQVTVVVEKNPRP